MMRKNYAVLLIICIGLTICRSGCPVYAESFSIKLTETIDMEFVRITSGSLTRRPGYREQPSNPVELASFYLGKYEVTQAQWIAIMGSWPVELYYQEKDDQQCESPSVKKTVESDIMIEEKRVCDNYPVYWVSFFDAARFCNALSIAQGLEPCYEIEEYAIIWNKNSNGYRLPTGDEWEYAATSGLSASDNYTETRHSASNPIQLNPIGQKSPNLCGLYDMTGNVAEWCWYQPPPPYITEEDVERWRNDPMESWRILDEPVAPTHKIRGHSLYHVIICSASVRRRDVGFRIARTVGP